MNEGNARRRLAEFFAVDRRRIAAETAEDPEPGPPFSREWEEWLVRDLGRLGQRSEVHESEALSTFPDDPAPLSSEGLVLFLEWCRRQDARRQARLRRVA